MRVLIGRLIHFLIMPCSRVPVLIEQQNAGELSFFKKVRLHIHLLVCKWCSSYARKVEQIDHLLTKKYMEEEKKASFEEDEIQRFKDVVKKKITR